MAWGYSKKRTAKAATFKRKLKPHEFSIHTEDLAAFSLMERNDRGVIYRTLRALREGVIKPEDYLPNKQTPREKTQRPIFTMPEPDVEIMTEEPKGEQEQPKTTTPVATRPVATVSSVDRRAFIEGEFTIIDKNSAEIPFKFNPVRARYYDILTSDYKKDIEGAREIILKSRQEGFSSLILALFAVDFLTIPNSVSICISHDRGATEKLFRKVHHFIESYCKKNGFDPKQYLSIDTKSELENATNRAYFYIKTAGSKVGARGGTALNLHFSESAFFESTERITATEIIEASLQQVPQDKGMVFMESTGGDYGSYFQIAWEGAKRGENIYKPRFFSWEEFYTDEYIQRKRLEYQTEEKFASDYPLTDEEAFIHSGSPFFDRKILMWMRQNMQRTPLRQGRLAADGEFMS